MKKIILLLPLLFSACTLSDTYWKPDVGPNNVGFVNTDESIEDFSGHCSYLFGLFKVNNDCSPDKIANKYNLKTITEVNTQKILFPFLVVQKNTITGISK